MDPVSIQAVIEEMDVMGDETFAYINRKTGELFTVHDEMTRMIENEDEDSMPDWMKEDLPKAREVLESDDFVPLPVKYDINDYSIMKQFCFGVEGESVRGELLNAIRGKGAFSRFKRVIYRREIQDDWYSFRNDALKEIASEFLELQGIPFVD